MDIKEITNPSRNAAQIIADLSEKQDNLKPWEDLVKEYDPMKHPVMTDESYRDLANKNGVEKMTRFILPLQKLAVKRMSELIFALPCKRTYVNVDNDQLQKAKAIIEDIYRKNRIDSVNLERARMLYASCEAITLWIAQEQETLYAGERSRLKLRCKSYSPMRGDKIYPLFDEYDDLIALSVKYTRTEDDATVTFFDCYTADEHIRWKNASGDYEEVVREKTTLAKIAGVYIKRDTPVWEEQSQNVFEAEWTLSRNGNYIRKNSRPNWVVFSNESVEFGGESVGMQEGRNVLQYPAGSRAEYVTWNQSIDSIKFHIDQIMSNFFKVLQLPDMSMENMKATPMSGEARKMMFIDAQLKVGDESGTWLEFLDREFNVIRAYAKLMFPSLASAFDALQVDIEVVPFQIKDESERISNLTNAAGGKAIMSQKTAIENLGYVDDTEVEFQRIQEESMSNLFNSPTV